ncbi:helix-turn-helix domain-containing protein [Acetobacter persici]|uniref:helix-turn-helix domain-containing protein n=1 Tax=Acetobacter persici TaxID=1076596 RepID=UPI00098D3531|nr:helix-turn-helix transcriptional regulator [Acetobacter persici]
MMLIPTPADIECAAARQGQSIGDVCKRAGVARSTFQRWKSGETSPTISVLTKLVKALGENNETPDPNSEAA